MGGSRHLSNILTQLHFDAKSVPKHHPTGRFGVHYQRKMKILPKMYFNQRFLNKDERFSKDACYLFMVAYFLEKYSLEREINISGQRGKPELGSDGEMSLKLNDAFDVFILFVSIFCTLRDTDIEMIESTKF